MESIFETAENVEISADGRTVWVHTNDGSTVGRFSTRFGLDVHTTVAQQLEGEAQCLACTHEPPSLADWHRFRELMQQHYGIQVDQALISEALLDGRWTS